MKVLAFLTVCAIALSVAQADSGKGKVGYCEDDSKCAANFACVSVQTTRANVEDVKQCLPNTAASPVCAGTQPGLCPSFSTTWGASFRAISSVCAYIIPQTKAKCIQKGSANSSKNVIECYFVQDPDQPNNQSATIGVIYGCVDFDGTRLLFKTGDKSDKIQTQLNYTTIINSKCVNPKNPSGSSFVCSSQGTCAPSSQNSMSDYSCKCNVGFSGKYCEKIIDNKCYNDGVCGGGSCDLTTMTCTKCKAGTTGNKCANCDPTATSVCSSHGKCVQTAGDQTSTLGADDGGSSSGASSAAAGSASASASTSTSTSSTSTSVGLTSSTAGSLNASDAGKVVAAGYRRLATKVFQCKCDDGYSDVHCGVKLAVKKNKTSTSSSTGSAATASASAPVTLSVLAALVATVTAAVAL
jgi:hypothetical protein